MNENLVHRINMELKLDKKLWDSSEKCCYIYIPVKKSNYAITANLKAIVELAEPPQISQFWLHC